jgi:predicted hydrocarbon binding protein
MAKTMSEVICDQNFVASVIDGKQDVRAWFDWKPLDGRMAFIDSPNIIVPASMFMALHNSMTRIVGEAAAGGVISYRAYMDLGIENVGYLRKKGFDNPETIVPLAVSLFSQMGWFKIDKIDRNPETRETIIRLSQCIESETFGTSAKTVCNCTSGLLTGIVAGAYGIKARGKETACLSKGDKFCEFVITESAA